MHHCVAQPALKQTVLVVEDDDLFRKALINYLGSLGYDPLVAESGEAALAGVIERPVELFLIDYHLPGMNGIEFARAVRERSMPQPMILLSGYLGDHVQREAQDAQIACVLRKPADMSRLEETIQTLIGGK